MLNRKNKNKLMMPLTIDELEIPALAVPMVGHEVVTLRTVGLHLKHHDAGNYAIGKEEKVIMRNKVYLFRMHEQQFCVVICIFSYIP